VQSLKWALRAEFMLDVIGAGATATTDIDWYELGILACGFFLLIVFLTGMIFGSPRRRRKIS
jgi:hypothetical protein